MSENMSDKWVDYAVRIQNIAQAGLAYCEDKYGRERYGAEKNLRRDDLGKDRYSARKGIRSVLQRERIPDAEARYQRGCLY